MRDEFYEYEIKHEMNMKLSMIWKYEMKYKMELV